MAGNKKKKGLGKGLSALLEDSSTDITNRYSGNGPDKVVGNIARIELDRIEPNPFQPRQDMDEESLAELVNSIREHGLIQPITVRKLGYDQYQVISGERRLKAAKLAELEEVPAYIRVANDQAMLEMALVENIHRDDLDPIEVALSYQRLIDECEETPESLSNKVGKKRATIVNYQRLLKLPEEIQNALREGVLGMGHARALINAGNDEERIAIARKVIENGLSVRKTEELVRAGLQKGPEKKAASADSLSREERSLRASLSSRLGADVALKKDDQGKGRIVIAFDSEEELQRIAQQLDS